MQADITYERTKSTGTNTTDMNVTWTAAESGETQSSAFTGSTGVLDARMRLDLDESVGVDIQEVAKIECTPGLSENGSLSILISVTPIKGDGTELTPRLYKFVHPDNVDTIQTDGGRPRQA